MSALLELDDLLAALASLAHEARSRGGTVLVSGEAGVGKTRRDRPAAWRSPRSPITRSAPTTPKPSCAGRRRPRAKRRRGARCNEAGRADLCADAERHAAADRHGVIVFQSTWHAVPGHTQPPRLFGQTFQAGGADNRYGIPAYYALHLWLWDHNPSGLFEDWNPTVRCP